ncbi:transporter substrate-binding domain-containing protein [Mesorhizobium sangaii]|uniref:Polar amino acid transport system substrate-binding protein n=1 Tax=Mesorhizobium sangaii TaxID=505389 RepID=A0A841PBC3_9HYPH|nr:transporter substrate-binding domain-containing protein [Mesorhizobium sangaii]MBB6407602.1 polar amino acid transport system substrate-binding protein [Mesorhizobium sangaii]
MTELKFAFLEEPPFCFTGASGEVSGCDVELARRLAELLGFAGFRPIEAEFAELLSGLVEGHWTMTTGLFVSEERQQLVDFTRPIWALQDGLLVAKDNPRGFRGYQSIARDRTALLGVITDQVQHLTALHNGIAPEQIRMFATQADVADAVANGVVHAYASVAMAHRGYLTRRPEMPLGLVEVPASEKQPSAGAFAIAKGNGALLRDIDACLDGLLGSQWHREMMARYGFSDSDIDRVI